jgi:hypothetical protein
MAKQAQTAADDPVTLTARWISEIEGAEKWQRQYWERCRKIVRRYRQERREQAGQPNEDERRFAILWANIQTLGPAVYAKTPEAVVSRRYKDSDPIGRYASEVIERTINFSIDGDGFADRMKLVRDDYLLLGRGQMWVRFVPHVANDQEPQVTNDADDEGSEDQKQVYAEVICDHVAYNDFGFTPCREWSEVTYVYRRVFMGRAKLVERFGKIGKSIPLDWSTKDDPSVDQEAKEKTKKAAIYEVWDKLTGKVRWFSKAYSAGPLDEKDDWLGLEGFFPCPRPVMATTPQDMFIPVPDYVYYQDQAEECDELTAKIGYMTDAIKTSGFYAGEENVKLQNLFNSKTNQLIAIDSMASLQDKGGMKGIIEWFPLEQIITALKTAFDTRKQILEDIYQITGISDIIRGATDPNETAAAQGLKSQWGSLRVRDKQEELARFARDIMRLMGEIVAKNYDAKTLSAITDVQLPTNQQKQAAQIMQQMAAQAQQTGQPPPPPPPGFPSPEILGRPSWEDVEQLLKSDAMRSFRIEIETDSTVQVDEDAEKRRRVEFITALAQIIGASQPALQAAPQLAPLVGKAIEFLARGFRAGREMEDVIEKVFDQVAQMPPQSPQQGMNQQEAQLKQADLQIKQQALQAGMAATQATAQDAQVRAQAEAQKAGMEHQYRMGQLQIDAAQLQQQAHQHAVDTAVTIHQGQQQAQQAQPGAPGYIAMKRPIQAIPPAQTVLGGQ